MKKLTLGLITLTIAVATIACKKKKCQTCFWQGMKNNNPIYVWQHKPSQSQIKAVQDTCACIVTLKQYCVPYVTDSSGNDFGCE